ncbi:MAG: C39 family peptidase [Daejeonella sp.]
MKKLNLKQLHAEFDVINEAESNSIKGGDWIMDFYNSHGSGTYSGSDIMAWGNDTYGGGYGGGGDWWQGQGNPSNPIQLNEVVISGGSGSSSGSISFGDSSGWNFYNYESGELILDPDGNYYNYIGGGSSLDTDLDCTYLPAGDGTGGQVGYTCTLEAFKTVAHFFNHNTTDINSVLDSYANHIANIKGITTMEVKLDLITQGINSQDFASFVSAQCDGLFTIQNNSMDALKSAVDAGHPVLASLSAGTDPVTGAIVQHEVVIIGYTDDNQVKYYDSQDARYHITNLSDFDNIWEIGGLKP